jgi:putative ABC transport system permease protein
MLSARPLLQRTVINLLRTPGFTLAAVLTLALGMGGAIALFSALYGAVLRTPPYPHSERIFRVVLNFPGESSEMVNVIQVRELAASTPDVEAVAAYTSSCGGPALMETTAGRMEIPAVWVDAETLALLGITPRLGPGFSRENFTAGEGVLLTHAFWQEHFGGDPGVIGRSLPLLGGSQPILGVLAAGAEVPFKLKAKLIRPLPPIWSNRRGEYRFTGLVRLRPGTDPRAVETAFLQDAQRQLREFPRNNIEGCRPRLEPLKTAMAGGTNGGFLLVCGAAGLLLLLATLNVAALFLNRSSRRAGETAIRLSLGASPRHILGQSLPESLLVAAAAALLGLLLAAQFGELLRHWLPGGTQLHGLTRAWAHPAVAAFAVGLVLLTGFLLGLPPLLQIRSSRLEANLRADANTARASHRVRDGLVVAQLAFATLLLVGVGLLGRSLQRLVTRPLGFDPAGLVTVKLEPSIYDRKNTEADPGPLLQALQSRPGIHGAALCSHIPGAWQDGFDVKVGWACDSYDGCSINVSQEAATLAESHARLALESVSEGYFRTLGLPLREGRNLTLDDFTARRRVCVIDEPAAKRLFPEGAIGRRLFIGLWCDFDLPQGLRHGEPLEIVGVVRDFANRGAEDPSAPSVYLPATLLPPADLLVRSSLPARALRAELDHALAEHMPSMRVASLQDIAEDRWERALPRRQVLALILPFGALALLLAALGLGTLMGSQVVQRTRELGVRAALGATPRALLQGVILRAAGRTALGMGFGLLLSFALVRTIRSLLFGVAAGDPATFAGAAAVLLATAILACLLPALRAARIAPAEALRSE